MKTHFYKEDILRVCDNWHLSVEEIYEKVTENKKAASRSSIYRNIDDMVQKWELRKLEWIWKKAYYEKNKWDHVHLIDRNTWEIIDLEKFKINISNLPKNFKINSMDIKVFWEFN